MALSALDDKSRKPDDDVPADRDQDDALIHDPALAGGPRVLQTPFFFAALLDIGENLVEILSYIGIVSR